MSIMALLEVAIGMIFVWLFVSLASMYIQEWIVGKLNWRSNMLETYIGNMLADPSLSNQIYDHPLIKGLHSGPNGEELPSYIPSAQFSFALLDIVRNSPKEAALIQKTLYELQNDLFLLSNNKRILAQKQLDLALNLTRRAVASEAGLEITSAMLDEVKRQIRKLSIDFPALQPMIESKFLTFAMQKKQIDSILADLQARNGGTLDETSLGQFKTGLAVMSLTYPDLKQALEALISEIAEFNQQAEDALLAVRKNIEDWFNNSMDRLSGWYKRRSQTLAFIIGITIAIMLNVDSLQLVTQLWREPIVREALALQAESLVNQNAGNVPASDAGQLLNLKIQISQLNIPLGWIGTGLPANENGAVLIGDGTEQLCTLTPKSSVEKFGIFISWANQCYPIINSPEFNDPTGWLLKLIGLFISGVAASQGAPFWFDILKKVVNIRSAGLNSDAEAQKGLKPAG